MHCHKSGETKRFSGLIPPAPWIAAAYNRPACENDGWNRRRPRNKAGRGSPLRPNPYNATGVRYWLHFNFIFFWNKNTVFCILFQLLSALHKPDFHFSYPADVINIKKTTLYYSFAHKKHAWQKFPSPRSRRPSMYRRTVIPLPSRSEKSDDMRTGTQGYANVGFRVVRTDFWHPFHPQKCSSFLVWAALYI